MRNILLVLTNQRNIQLFTQCTQDFILYSRRRIFLLKGNWKTLKKRFIQHIGADKTSIIRTLTFSICGSNYSKSCSRFDILTNLLQEDTFTFQNRLQAQNLIGCKINLIEKQYSTTLQCFNYRTVMPNSFTIYKAKTTNQIIFIRFYSNIDADQFTTQLSTRLLHTERLAITRQTRNEYWIEDTGSNNFLETAKITKLDEGIIFGWNKILCYFSSFTKRHTVIYNTF